MAFDPVQPSWTAGLVAGIFYVLRMLDRKMKRNSPDTVEYLATRIARIDERLESLERSNRHRRAEIAEQGYEIRQLGKRIDAESNS